MVERDKCGGEGGDQASDEGGGCGCLLGREREGSRNQEEVDFLAYFRPDFLPPQAMKPTPIYNGWNRVILSTHRKTFSHRFGWEGSQPLIQSVHRELSNL